MAFSGSCAWQGVRFYSFDIKKSFGEKNNNINGL